MSETARMALVHGIAAAKAGDVIEARNYLERVLYTDATTAQKIRAWEYLARIADDPARKRDYLENILAHDMSNPFARRELAVLNGQLDRHDMVDATHRETNAAHIDGATEVKTTRFGDISSDARAAATKRYVCPQCGGVMAYSPESGRLECRYCGYAPETAANGSPPDELDFAVALATDKGHSRPVATKTFHCEGCGAPFIAGAAVLAMRCPYCHSPHVVEDPQGQNLIPPEGIIPPKITAEQAKEAFYEWLKQRRLFKECEVSALAGVYLPVWTFDVAGNLSARIRSVQLGWKNSRAQPVEHTIQKPVFYDDVPVAASRRLPAGVRHWVNTIPTDAIVPFEERFLADWLADIYEISPSDASLEARKIVWQQEWDAFKKSLEAEYNLPGDKQNTVSITVSSAGLRVEAFKLILAPVWIAKYRYDDKIYQTVINGYNSKITGELPPGKFKRWLKDLFD